MEDKEMLQLAIHDTDMLSKKQKTVFSILCDSDFPLSSLSIEKKMGVTRQAVYLTLQALLKRGFINREKDRIYVYQADKLKKLELIERYKQKIS